MRSRKPPLAAGGFRLLGEPKGRVVTQGTGSYDDHWTHDSHLWWTGAAVGDQLDVVLPVEKAGTYRVSVLLIKARDYGVVELSIDGQKAAEPIDLYHPTVVRTEPIPLGTFRLEAGERVLKVKIVGANEKAIKFYMFGLDEVVLEEVP